MKTLNILNGQAMYDYFKKTRHIKDEVMVPFNEAMCYGQASEDIFSEKFIHVRSQSLNVPIDQYKEITLEPLSPLFSKTPTLLTLWFDTDMFCQINVLTLLAWLDQNNFHQSVLIYTVDDQFDIINKERVEPKGYKALYRHVVLNKSMPEHVELPYLNKGIKLYLNYLQPDGELITFINEHKALPENELVALLLRKFTHYGLGDIQYLEIIKNNR